MLVRWQGFSHVWAALLLATALPMGLLALGCEKQNAEQTRRGPTQSGARGGLFESVAENFDHFEDFETEQILKQTCDRLNQWYLQEKPEVKWQLDPLLAGLSEELRGQPEMKMIEGAKFQDPEDGWYLQEAVWLRDVSKTARADQFDDLSVAKRLFDWTVRNTKLEPDFSGDESRRVRHRPFETLLYGRGTAIERAWLFILLARQQGLGVVFLGLADKDGAVKPWLPALVQGDQLYLFDTTLGFPIPGPTPGSVATLDQVIADDGLLRKLDLDAEHPYPVKADDLKHVVAYVEATPPSLSRRMALVESRLTGGRKMKLTSPGSALAERVAKIPHVSEVKLWPMPFEVYLAYARRTKEQQTAALKETVLYQAMPTLRMARVRHFKGEYDGEQGAKTQYLNARPPDRYIEDYHLPPDVAQKIPRESLGKYEAAQSLLMREAKQAATYWLGLVFFDQKDYPNSIDFLANRALGGEHETPWADAARYNLARAYEAAGENPKSIELYEADKSSPQSHGNQLRARWLKEKDAPAEAKEGTPETAKEPAAESDSKPEVDGEMPAEKEPAAKP
jgi:hypothetical protein